MNPVVIIPTYDRPQLLKKLLSDIDREMPDAKIYVFNDGSKMDYTQSINEKTHYRKMMEHCGKRKFWKLVSYMFHCIKVDNFDYVFFLPDDIRLQPGMFEKCVKAYNDLKQKDANTICLSVGYANGRVKTACWTNYKPHKVNEGIYRTQWNDMCFMAERKFFDVLGWAIPPISGLRWKTNPKKSSGVGKHISTYLHRKGFSMYHLEKSQCIFSNHNKSMMQKGHV